jgi:hypothetical protein
MRGVNAVMKLALVTVAVLGALTLHAETIRVIPVSVPVGIGRPAGLQFYCDQGYNPRECVEDIGRLRSELLDYHAERLGRWSFVVAPSERWKEMVRELSGNPRSPAFTLIDERITVFEQALFKTMPLRDVELLQTFGATGDALLRVAITHELGHAICHESDERRADDFGLALRQGRSPSCYQPPIDRVVNRP